jgi:hypothetical protein
MGVVAPNEIKTPKAFKHFVFLEKKPLSTSRYLNYKLQKKKDTKIGVLGLGFVARVIVNQGISQAYEIKTNKKLRCGRKRKECIFFFYHL